jgi:peroxiredoxin Q/BCP
MAQNLQPGDPAPSFQTLAIGGSYGEDGRTVSLEELLAHGKPVVLYFYPKDDTPGCTKQACALRDEWSEFAEKTTLLGVSIDDAVKHRKFISKHELPFPLLVDEDKQIVEAYGVWVEKSMYGKKYMGTERATFVIAPDGKISHVHRKVRPAEHNKKLLASLES